MVALVTLLSAAVWAVCAGLRAAVHSASEGLFEAVTQRSEPSGALILMGVLIVGGLIRGFLAMRPAWKDAAGDGMDVALDNYHITYRMEGDDPQPRYSRSAFGLALRKALATFITLGTGGSGGLEAPTVLISECLGTGWARVMRVMSEHELRTYQLAAIGAGISTLLGAPFTAALFAVEIAYGDRIIYRKFAYCLLAAIVPFILTSNFLPHEPLFSAPPHSATYTLAEYAIAALVAVGVSAPLAAGFGWVMRRAGDLVRRLNFRFHGPAGAIGTGFVALALWYGLELDPRHVLGGGEQTISLLLRGGVSAVGPWWLLSVALLGRMIAVGFTLESGGSAGLLIPSMFLGGVSGALTAEALSGAGVVAASDAAPFVVAGIASALVAVISVPLAAIALVLEVFGSAYGPPAIVACGLTYVLTLRFSMYAAQRQSPDPLADETGAAET